MNLSYQGRPPPHKLTDMAARSSRNGSFGTELQTFASFWLADKGCNSHFTPDFTVMILNSQYNGEEAITVANGQGLPIAHTGFGSLSISQGIFIFLD